MAASTLYMKMYQSFFKQAAFAKVATLVSVTRLERAFVGHSEFNENSPEIAQKGMGILHRS